MIAVLVRILFRFFLPGGFLLLAGILFSSSAEIIHWRPVVAKVSLLVVPAACLLVCWRFNKFKPVFAVLVLLLAEWALQSFCRGVDIDPGLAMVVRDTLTVLLPLNLAWLALGRETGLVNIMGLVKLTLIVVQPLMIAYIYFRQPEMLTYLGREFSPWDFTGMVALAQPAIAAYLIALVVLLINWSRQRGVIDIGFVWALLASYFGLAVYTGLLSTICLMLGGMILAVSVVEAAYVMAFRDDLTGLPARRALNELLLKLRGDYTIAMLDIDFFKKFNDSYGHDVGDQVLKMVASQIARVTGGGRPFRYGGEEFTVVFPGKKLDDVAGHLEKIRSSVESTGFAMRKQGRPKSQIKGRKGRGHNNKANFKKVGVTISIGVASRDDRTSKAEQVVKRADLALYKAKEAGRNRVVF
jgi:diguanylate cyclase (GGDEF)-like protein